MKISNTTKKVAWIIGFAVFTTLAMIGLVMILKTGKIITLKTILGGIVFLALMLISVYCGMQSEKY